MTEPIFSEKRTRSQLTLPDNILQIPDRSPLKGARTALRNHTVADPVPSSSTTPPEESDDGLLLSPRKKATMKKSSSSKRSASPPPQDEYTLRPGSPPDVRELKRIKRDGFMGGKTEGDIAYANPAHQSLTSGHSRHQSNPNLGGHLARKQLATDRKKPVSTVSDGTPPPTCSAAPTSPKISRAQSEPLIFPKNGPRIDFTNPPASPKRRSGSRSPSKERGPRLRITASGAGTPRLPTIPDDIAMDVVHSESEGDIHEGSAMRPIPVVIQSTTSQEEIVPPSPPSRELVPASPPMKQAVLPSLPRTSEVVPPSPSPPPSSRTTALVPPTMLAVPTTPATQPLSNLISMSPLTPLPETPLPPRAITDSGVDDRFTSNGWGIIPMKELTTFSQPAKPHPKVTSSTAQSRLPRFTTAVPSIPTSTSQPSAMGPPALKKTAAPAVGVKASTSAPTINAFNLMMKEPLAKRAKLEEQRKFGHATDKGKKPMQPGPSSKPKQKAKQKMRPREKPEPQKALRIVPLPDEDDDEEQGESLWGFKSEPKLERKAAETADTPEEVPSARVSPEPPTVPTEDAAMANETQGEITAEEQSVYDTQMVEDGAMQDPEDQDFRISALPEPSQPGKSANAEDIPKEIALDKEVQEVQPSVDAAAPETSVPRNEATKPEADDEELSETTEPRPLSRTGKSKLPLGKKRQPVSTAAPARITRSVSNRRNNPIAEGSKAGIEASRKKPAARPAPAANKRAVPDSAKKPVPVPAVAVETQEDVLMNVAEEQTSSPPGSPMKTSPIRSSPKASSADKEKDEQGLQVPTEILSAPPTPSRSRPRTPSASPSPTKIARSALMAMRPTAASIARTFSSKQPNSSLSTLSNALEKLRMPPPSRPSTSMGFNRDLGADDDDAPARSNDDVIAGRASTVTGRASGSGSSLQRSATLGSSSFKPKSTNGITSSSKAPTATGKNLVQKPLSMFMSSKGGIAKPGGMGPGARRMGFTGGKTSIFGVGGGPRRTVSKKTTLPVVIGSPVKGKSADESMREYGEAADDGEEEGGSIFNAIVNGSSATHLLENLLADGPDKGKEKEATSRPVHSSRRVSMLSRDLSLSLSALPPAVPAVPAVGSSKGQMGPPPTPPSGSRSSKGAGSSPSSSPSQAGRRSARIAKIAPAMKAKASNEGNTPAEVPNPAVEALKILKDCVIFVDVKTDDGDEAGMLFMEMLEGVGARVLTRVGQTCTHIVFKNGLMSTITRWKLLRDPKPLAVGIGWVVECIEQKRQVPETDFLIDLMHTNVAGTHKRRRSMLPKLFGEEEPERDESLEGDHSMDGSVSSITMDDDLTPLERARRRKSMLTGPRS